MLPKKFYPKKYHEIYPQILRLHTWVGYDVDGRGDIFWNNTFSKRLQVKIEQLIIYCSSISDLLKKPCCKPTQKKIVFFKKKITSAILLNKKILKSFSKSDFLENSDEFKKISNTMFKKKADLITDSNLILDIIEEAILLEVNRKELKKNLVDELVLLKIEIKNFGLGLGRTQVRLNANQLNNSISKEIDLKGDLMILQEKGLISLKFQN